MKRLVSMILVLTMAFSCSCFPAYAVDAMSTDTIIRDPLTATLSNVQTLLLSVSEEPEAYGIAPDSLSNLTLGAQILSFVASNGELVESSNYIYPLYSDGELIALITSFYVNGILESMISTDFVDDISELDVETQSYAIIYDCNGVQLVTENGTEMIDEYPYDLTRSPVTSIELAEIDSVLEVSAQKNGNLYTVANGFDNGISTASVTGSGNATMNVYKYNQGAYHLCWAFSIASIGNTLWGSEPYDGVDVAQALYGTSDYDKGANTTQALQMLNTLYYYQYGISTATLAESTAYDFINAQYPIFMKYYCAASDGNHAAVLRAINTSTHYFSIMNPGNGTYQGFTNSSGNYAITYNAKTWTLENWGYYYYLY